MKPERWQHIKSLLQSALEQEPVDRAVFLTQACAHDESLRKDVESFIASFEQAGGFIESPAFELMAESLSNQTESMVGHSFGPYQITTLIGTGGMGEVYLAEDARLGRKVALKMLPAVFTMDDDRVRRFQQEARAASALNHPNILTIYEIGQLDSRHFIATEFIEGETLRQHMAQTKMDIGEALDVAIQVTSALATAHQAGIVHRDIKPENIIVRQDGLIKVLDFGLAKLVERKQDDPEAATLVKTKQGLVMGTAHYMSPEQARGLDVDARTDLFSLGVVLYEMVAGRVPFEGETMTDVLAAILRGEAPPLNEWVPAAPTALQSIVTRALCKVREERYQTAKELLSDLKRLAEEPKTTSPAIQPARVTSSAEYVVGGIKRHKIGVAVVAAIFLLIAGLLYFSFTRRSQAIDSLAVLPFINSSADPNTEYLSDGLTESIIYDTSKLPNLKVVPRSSVFRYKGKEMDAQTVGHELGVSAVLTGTVSQRGDGISISAELIDVRDNRLLWGQQYNRKITDLLAVQEEISREISERMRLRLTGEEQKRLTKRYTENTEAYQLYLQGRYYWFKRTREGYKKATEHFEQAIEKDPSYALAYAGLADCYNVLPSYGILPPKESFAKGKAAATKALEIDDTLAEAHTSLAYIKFFYDWDWSGAESEFQRAIELNPGYGTAHQWYALEMAGRDRMDEAMREIKRAQELDPLSLIANVNAGWIFYHSRQYDLAIEQDRKSLDMDPNFARGHVAISEPLEQEQRYEEAIAELQKARQLDETPIMLALLGHVYAVTGKGNEARKVVEELNELSKRMYVDPYFLAEIYTALGERDHAFQELEKAYDQRSSWLVWLKVEPKFDGLRSDPRFKDLLRRVGLT